MSNKQQSGSATSPMGKRAGFVRNTAVMAGGSAVAQAITLLLTPVITRLFVPETFGLFATVLALGAPFVAVASLRYHEAIMLPHHDRAASAVFRLALVLVVIMALVLSGVAALAGDTLVGIFSLDGRSELLFAVPIMVLLIGVRRVFDARLQRARRFGRIAGSTVTGAIVDRTITIGIGLVSPTAWVLIAGKASGMGSAILLMLSARHTAQADTGEPPEFTTIREAAKRYAHFAKYSWSGAVMQLSRELPVLVFGAIFGVGVAGLYVLARRVLMEPAILVGEALSKTFYERTANLHRQGKPLHGVTRSLVEYLMRWSVPPMALVAFAAPDIFEVVFGARWREAGVYSVLLMPMFFVGFTMQSLTRLFNVLEKQKEMATFSLLNLGGIMAGIALGVMADDIRLACIIMSSMVLLIGLTRVHWIFGQIDLRLMDLLPHFSKTVALAVVWSSPVIGLRMASISSPWILASVALGLCALYTGYLALTDERIRGLLRERRG